MKAVPALCLVLLAAACGQPEEAAEAPPPPVPYAGPATLGTEAGEPVSQTVDYQWGYSGGDGHLLAFGAQGGALIDVVFRCEPSSPGVNFAFFRKGSPPIQVKVGSGTLNAVYPVRPAKPEDPSGEWTLNGEVPEKDAVLAEFLKTGRMARIYGEEAPFVMDAVTAGEKADIKKFADGCRSKL